MKINRFPIINLRNEEHYQFQSEFKALVEKYNPELLKIKIYFDAYTPLFVKENEAIVVIQKSSYSPLIEKADDSRISVYTGLSDSIKSALNHYDEAKKAAAKRIRILLDRFGAIHRKTNSERTTAFTKLDQEFNGNYAADIAILDLGGWVTELNRLNKNYISLTTERFEEDSKKSLVKMKEARHDIDKSYNEICERIDAMSLLYSEEIHKNFILELNTRVDKYSDILAQRKGRSKKNKKNGDKNGNPSIEDIQE